MKYFEDKILFQGEVDEIDYLNGYCIDEHGYIVPIPYLNKFQIYQIKDIVYEIINNKLMLIKDDLDSLKNDLKDLKENFCHEINNLENRLDEIK